MNRAEKLRRAGEIRHQVDAFRDLNIGQMRQQSSSPDREAMDNLLLAKQQLDDLIEDLRNEGYGQQDPGDGWHPDGIFSSARGGDGAR